MTRVTANVSLLPSWPMIQKLHYITSIALQKKLDPQNFSNLGAQTDLSLKSKYSSIE
jgi:hypothetical protein